MATGTGKTTVMAMLIAWQTVNAVRTPGSNLFSRGFLIVTPGITIKDRLRVLQPERPGNYYRHRELVPADMLPDIATRQDRHHQLPRVQTPRDAGDLARSAAPCSRAAASRRRRSRPKARCCSAPAAICWLQERRRHQRRGAPLLSRETAQSDEEARRRGSDEAKKNNEAARLWISGIEALKRKSRRARRLRSVRHAVLPARLRLSRGHAVPLDGQRLLADGRDRVRHREAAARPGRRQLAVGATMPIYRNLWDHIGKEMPKKGAGKARRARSARTCRPSCRRRSMRSTATTRRHSRNGRAPASRCRRCSSSSATTPRPRSWSTSGFRASSATDEDERDPLHRTRAT